MTALTMNRVLKYAESCLKS